MWRPVVLIEMKKRGEKLTRHYRQAIDYWTRLVPGRPRYIVLCNFDEFWVYDFETQMDSPVGRTTLATLAENFGPLAFLQPGQSRPVFDNDHVAVTRKAADKLAACYNKFRARDVPQPLAQRFILQILVSFFAEDIGLLEKYVVARLLDDCTDDTAFDLPGGLFTAMNTPGGTPGGRFKGVPYFNGGLFAEPARLELTGPEIVLLRDCAKSDWSKVQPEIFGAVFEHTLGAKERHASGAHFTYPADIMKIIGPTIVEPWREQIDAAKTAPRQVQPLHLTHRDGRWYLVGHDLDRAAMRTFALGRITDIELSARWFERPKDFSVDRYFAAALGVMNGHENHHVRIRFSRLAADHVRDRYWHESQEITELPDGRLELRLRLADLLEIERLILQWGGHAEALEPPELRARLVAAGRKLAATHG